MGDAVLEGRAVRNDQLYVYCIGLGSGNSVCDIGRESFRTPYSLDNVMVPVHAMITLFRKL